MAIVGSNNFSGGVTALQRVSPEGQALLARCSGFRMDDGALKPDGLVEDVTTGDPLSGTTPEQVPFAFVDGSLVTILTRDADEAVREWASGSWGAAGDSCDILTESFPVKLGRQVIFPTDGTNPRLMVYEPGSSSTKLRPLSLKSPVDYRHEEKPALSASTAPDDDDRLFDCEDANVWTSADASCTVDNTGTDVDVFTIDENAPQSTKIATKSLGSTGIDTTGKSYLVLDVYLSGDPQVYETAGVFSNNSFLRPSGYSLGLYSDTGCTSLLDELEVPKIEPLGSVSRIVFRLDDSKLTLPIKGLALITASYYTKPASNETFTLKLYSESFNEKWEHKGNFLMGGIVYEASPWAEKLQNTEDDEVQTYVPTADNLLFEPGFETVAGWTFSGSYCKQYNKTSHSGSYSVEVSSDNAYVTRTANDIIVSSGNEYAIEWWYYLNAGPSIYQVEISSYTSGDVLIQTDTYGTYTISQTAPNWLKKEPVYWTAPANAAKANIKFKAISDPKTLAFDDINFYPLDNTQPGSAWVLETFAENTPAPHPWVRYAYVYAGKDILGSDTDYNLMISNPSAFTSDDNAEISDNKQFADPWRTYTLTITLPGGPLSTIAVNAGGTGYSVDDVLEIDDGIDGYAIVTSVNAGVVTGVSLLEAGTNYTTASGVTTQSDDGGTGCTLNITALTPMTEYGDYLTYVLIYRQIANELGIWSAWEYIGNKDIAASVTFDDPEETDESGLLNSLEVPLEMEITNDYADSARHVVVSDGRVYAACLDWDPTANDNAGAWTRKTAIEVSGYRKPWAFATVNTDESLVTDGGELDGYAVTGSEVRGILARNEDKFVFLDNEFFLLRGDNPIEGWQFTRLDSVGCVSARTLADCRAMLIWHDGLHFYGYSGGLAQPISKWKIDSTLIDFTMPHNAVFANDQYIFFCEYNGNNALLVYDVDSGAWRIRYSDALADLVGICTAGISETVSGIGASPIVYGLTSTGEIVSLFGSSDNDLDDETPTREVWTQFVQLSSPFADVHVTNALFEVETDQGLEISLEFNSYGAKNSSAISRTLTAASTQTRYRIGLNMNCEAIQVKATYTGTTPPTIRFIGYEIDDVLAG